MEKNIQTLIQNLEQSYRTMEDQIEQTFPAGTPQGDELYEQFENLIGSHFQNLIDFLQNTPPQPPFKLDFSQIYPKPLYQRLKELNPTLDLDTIDIDYNNDEPNTLFIQHPDDGSITIGQMIDAIGYCLALIDIDLKEYQITEQENLWIIKITDTH